MKFDAATNFLFSREKSFSCFVADTMSFLKDNMFHQFRGQVFYKSYPIVSLVFFVNVLSGVCVSIKFVNDDAMMCYLIGESGFVGHVEVVTACEPINFKEFRMNFDAYEKENIDKIFQ